LSLLANNRKCYLVILVLFGLSFLYWALNTRGTFRFHEVPTFVNYDMLAEAFSYGKLHLSEAVHPERIQAADPAHPGLPYPYLRDAVVFQGLYYFLQEPLPGAIHMIWRKMTGWSLPTGAAIIVVALGSFLIMGVLLALVRDNSFRDTPVWLAVLVWMSFALSGSQLYIVSRPIVYHETIGWAVFFILCAVAFFFRLFAQSPSSNVVMFACGLCSGFAVLSRMTLVTYSVSFGVSFVLISAMGERTWREISSRLLVFAVPLICCIGLLLIYNLLRFGDFLDFGRSRVIIPSVELYEYCCLGGKFFSTSHVMPNLQTYLFGLPDVSYRYLIPWVRFPQFNVSMGDVFLTRETVASLFIMMPILIAAAPIAIWHKFRAGSNVLWGGILTCWFASLASFAVFVPLVTIQARYLYEVTPLMFLVVYYNLAVLWREVKNRPELARLVSTGIVLLVAFNCVMGLYVGLNGMVQWR
jgi:hypothetical protein